MTKGFHAAKTNLLACLTLAGILTAGLGATVAAPGAAHAAGDVSYFGRWQVNDADHTFSAKSKPYKTIDIAPCGKDFCGVAVGDDNSCGATLFRFLTIHAHTAELRGHGRWGSVKKIISINYRAVDNDPPSLMLGIGEDDLDFTGREGSLPTFEANYGRVGEATCKADRETS